MNEFTEKIKTQIEKFPHSPTRIPYTYHHDYLRGEIYSKQNYSRGDIAAIKNWSEEELYSTALVYLLKDLNPLDIITGNLEIDTELCKQAITIVEQYTERIKNQLPIHHENTTL